MIDCSPRRFEACMARRTLGVAALLLVPALAWPRQGPAQTFKTAKFSIGGDGGTDYLTAEPGTGRVFVSRSTHVIVVDGPTGKVAGDIPDTPRTHGIALAPKSMPCVRGVRSEEHTSELQSLRHLVCRLLLEKKKQQKYNITHNNAHESA